MRTRKKGLVVAALTALSAMALLAPVAQGATPKPGYEQFRGCPSQAEIPIIVGCAHTLIKGGHFQMGSKDVPLSNPMTLTGGFDENGKVYANSEGGLTPVKQKVPGGVVGLTGLTWLLELLGSEALTLYAVTEIAGQPSIGATLNLPIKVHLVNGVLGNNCYVGSVSNPINLALTTGTTSPPPPNKPISGKPFEFKFDFEKEIITQNGGTWVDNSFAAPGASGCVLTLFGFIPISINGLVNSQSGLPSPAGTNETTQVLDLQTTGVVNVY